MIFTESCKFGEKWSSCAIQCNKTCDHYYYFLKKEGICNEHNVCVPGKTYKNLK